MTHEELEQGIGKYETHLSQISNAFNSWAEQIDLPVRMNADKAVKAVKDGVGLGRVAPFWSRIDDTGIIHETQLKTAIDCLHYLLEPGKRCGHVVGAMQSGKTTTSLALQWAGPVLYMLTGKRAYPFYIIGNQTNHEDQTKTELDRFLAYYGNVELQLFPGTRTNGEVDDAMFTRSPSLATYREHVLRGALEDYLEVPQLEDLVHRRVGGQQGLRKIADLCQRATGQGYHPLMIIDEPQFGASDRIVVTESESVVHKCVLARIFERIEQELGTARDAHWFIGLSATPFELNDLEMVWEVRQYLTESYSGFNFFNGRPISPDVSVVPPRTMGLTEFAEEIQIPFLTSVSMSAYNASPKVFAQHARKVGYSEDHSTYKKVMEETLRGMIYALVEKYGDEGDEAVGLCIRAFNDNARTQALVGRLGLDPDRVEVIEYFGPEAVGLSVKKAILRRKTSLPYVVFVTNRARMADAFPKEVRFFMDLAQKASDLNALLQGLLGRACGYNKKSTVVLSDANAEIMRSYVATGGKYVHRTSRHSMTLGGFRRGAPTGMLKLRSDLPDPIVNEFFNRINREVVNVNVPPGSAKLGVLRRRGGAGFRTGPILLIAEELGLFDHIEEPSVRMAIFPQIPTGFHVVRRGESARHSRQSGESLTYSVDQQGNCRYTFRWSDRASGAQGGAAGRAKGQRDSGEEQHMEPTIYLEKFDPSTGNVIEDRSSEEKSPGNWRAFMVTFPLKEPVREIQAAEIALPIEASPYSSWMTPNERVDRDAEVRRKEGRKS